MTDVQNVITQAKLAEQTERYEEMVDFMKTVVDLSKGKLGIEERNLLSVAYKNVVGSKRASYRHLVAMEAKEEPKEKKEVIVEYRQKVEKELSDVCASVIDVLDKYLIPSAEQDESKVFYLKMCLALYMVEETFYTDVLAKSGYICSMSGKYHLGNSPVPQHSFTHWFVHQSGGGSYIKPPVVKNGKCIVEDEYVTDLFTDDAIEFLTKEWDQKTPFYMSVHYTAPHSPYTGTGGRADTMHPKKYVDMYANCSFHSLPQEPMDPHAKHLDGGLTRGCLGNRQCLLGYFAAVTAMDANVGRLMDTLKTLNIDNETLIVFSSDHGFNAGQHGLWGKGNAAYPQNMFDTSLRIPFIVRHKDVITPGVDSSVVQVIDVAPTLLEYAGGLVLPNKSNNPGVSFASALLDPSKRNQSTDRQIYGEYGRVRYSRDANYKYVNRVASYMELYDLQSDPKEKNNVVNDKTHQSEIHGREIATREFFSFYEDPFLSGWFLPVTGTGQRRPVLYNATGMPTTPAFGHITVT